MTASKAKGTRFESAVVAAFHAAGMTLVERRALRGTRDAGDLTGIPGWVCELKDRTTPAYGTWMAEAARAARNAGARWYCVIHKARRAPGVTGATEDAYVVMPLRVFIDWAIADQAGDGV